MKLRTSAVRLLLTGALVAIVGETTAVQRPSAQTGHAFFVRSLTNPADRREARPDVLDTPILPGSVMKAVTLVAALESQVIEPTTARMCRRAVTIDGHRYVCAHPDLKRPLTPAEALAHSCNDFFASLAPRLSRQVFNSVRVRAGLPPVAADANLAAAFVGLDGPRITPRALLDLIARLSGSEPGRPLEISASARRVLREGLRAAAQYGTAAALGARGVRAMAKTATAPMPGGAWMGIVVALEPADVPERAAVVVAPGGGGADAATIAADLLSTPESVARDVTPAKQPPAREQGSVARDFSPATKQRVEGNPAIRIGVSGAGNRPRATTVDLEDYVARVVAGEGQPNASDAAQQALAITVRTFALANRNRHRSEGYDLCDTTHCQVTRSATPAARRAAAATAGRVLVENDQPAAVFYSAWCGGRSELASNLWPGAVVQGLAPREDQACAEEPGWTSEIPAAQIERALKALGHRGDRLRDLRVIERNDSGRVSRLRVEGFSPAEVAGHDLRIAVGRLSGWQLIKSTAFELRRTGTGYRFTGRGFGHGVGLCVIGAGRRAAAGASAEEILRFYFPRLRIESGRGVSKFSASGAVPTPARPGTDLPRDVMLALPGEEEPERALVMQLVRSARDEIVAKAGVASPATIRLTVHPTAAAFGRVTGQPWWVSGATSDAAIDLLPLTILRQRGQLERTIRHEVAHVLLDAALARRPLWVREGAAFYFADRASEGADRGRPRCPTDEEFLRPVSAGSHRDAYARAEACFRRQLAEGRRWRDIK